MSLILKQKRSLWKMKSSSDGNDFFVSGLEIESYSDCLLFPTDIQSGRMPYQSHKISGTCCSAFTMFFDLLLLYITQFHL
jgi:hypothetical protein